MGFAGASDGKESACNAGDLVQPLGWEEPPGEGNGYLFQYSCLENSMDKEAWQATVSGVSKSRPAERLTLSLFVPSVTCQSQSPNLFLLPCFPPW